MQQLQLSIFWAIVIMDSLRLYPHAQTKKKATNGNLAASSAGRISARLFCSRKRKGRRRAAGERYRPLKKLDQVCDPRVTRY